MAQPSETTLASNSIPDMGRFLADLSHEVRGPLNAALGFAELLADGAFGELNEAQSAAADDILHASQLLQHTLTDALDIARLAAGSLRLESDLISLAAVVAQAVRAVEALAIAQQAEIRVTVADEVAIWADERRVEQIVAHLLSNALKYGPVGGTVRLTASAEGQQAVIAVTDAGPGILPADQERIFEPFVALRPIDAYPGAGLGLALGQRLARALEGDLHVCSTPGSGATFRLVFPLREAPTNHAASH